jgi:hypothetical protein
MLIGGYTVRFPFTPYPSQLLMMDRYVVVPPNRSWGRRCEGRDSSLGSKFATLF